MSEEILKALTQLFAIITKQDDGVSDAERNFVVRFFEQELNRDSVKEYVALFEDFLVDKRKPRADGKERKRKLTSVGDSVRILGICKKINKTLSQKQKIVVLIKILELVDADIDAAGTSKMEIIETVADVFKFEKDEYQLILNYVLNKNSTTLNSKNILVVSDNTPESNDSKHAHTAINGELIFIRVESVDMYFVKYIGTDEINLNGFIMEKRTSLPFFTRKYYKNATRSSLIL